jgi:hypothetical protein
MATPKRRRAGAAPGSAGTDEKAPKVRKPTKLNSDPWYQCPEGSDELAQKAFTDVQRLHSQQAANGKQLEADCLDLFEGNAARELGLLGASLWGIDPATFNIIGSCVDTRCAHVLKNKIRPFLMTEQGKYEERETAKAMQSAIEGTFHEAGIYGELGQHVCWDGEIFRAGAVKVTPDYPNNRVVLDRIKASDVYLDTRDAQLGKPTTWRYVTTIDRGKLLSLCDDASDEVKQAILDAKPAAVDMYADEEDLTESETSDRVAVCELWHLPSGRVDRKSENAWKIGVEHDGRHTMVLWSASEAAHVLLDEAWPYAYPPIAFYRPKKKRRGFWSESLPERHVGSQLAINRMLTRVDGVLDLLAIPHGYVNRRAKINTDKVNNSWSSLIEGDGPPGQAIAWIPTPTLGGEYFNHIMRLIQWVREREGISELSANSARPPGEWSGIALETLIDNESIRSIEVFRAWEDFHVQLARLTLDAYRMLKEGGCNMVVVFGNGEQFKRIDLSELDLEEDSAHVTFWPTNLLPQTPAAKRQAVIDLSKAFPDFMSPGMVLELLDFPDLKAALGDKGAAEANIKRQLDRLLAGEHVVPHPYLALERGKALGIDRLNQLESQGAPESKLDPLRQWIEDVQTQINKLKPPAPPPPAPTGPLAPPMQAA